MSSLSLRANFTGPKPAVAQRRRASQAIYATQIPCSKTGMLQQLDVHLAVTSEDRERAAALLNRMYDWRGYGNAHQIPASPRHSTFLASLDGELVGTITLAVDAGEGLAADAIFHDELNTFRRVPGASPCELVKFAFDAEMPSRKLLASLFHIVFLYGKRHHRCTDLFIEVNPRHRRYYEAMLGFQPIGGLRTNESVAAPSQLMWLKVSDIATQISAHAGRPEPCSRSLYPLFLSHSDQRAVLSRLIAPGHGPSSLAAASMPAAMA